MKLFEPKVDATNPKFISALNSPLSEFIKYVEDLSDREKAKLSQLSISVKDFAKNDQQFMTLASIHDRLPLSEYALFMGRTDLYHYLSSLPSSPQENSMPEAVPSPLGCYI